MGTLKMYITSKTHVYVNISFHELACIACAAYYFAPNEHSKRKDILPDDWKRCIYATNVNTMSKDYIYRWGCSKGYISTNNP